MSNACLSVLALRLPGAHRFALIPGSGLPILQKPLDHPDWFKFIRFFDKFLILLKLVHYIRPIQPHYVTLKRTVSKMINLNWK